MEWLNDPYGKFRIKVSELKELQFTDGWNGGQWNNWEVLKNPEQFFIILNKGEEYSIVNARSTKVHGVDYDMGHQYSWSSTRLIVEVPTQFGYIGVNILDLSKDIKILYLERCDVFPLLNKHANIE